MDPSYSYQRQLLQKTVSKTTFDKFGGVFCASKLVSIEKSQASVRKIHEKAIPREVALDVVEYL